MEKDPKYNSDAGHRSRLRNRFLKDGLDGFLDYEVVELLLTLSTPRKDCKPAAKAAMARFKTFRGVLEASARELTDIEGLGTKNTLALRLVKAVLDRYLEKRLVEGMALKNSRDLFDYLGGKLGGRSTECFMAVFLDARNRVIAGKILFEGTLTASSVYPREVVRAAIDHHAAALILAHNHPSGDPRPSAPDLAITRRLMAACRVMDITLHEHLIVGDKCYYSFADEGHIRRFTRELDEMPP